MLSQQSRDIIDTTLPTVGAHVNQITEVFYPLMFERYPAVKDYFNRAHQATGTQPRALANAVVAYASNLDRLEVLGDTVGLIVQKRLAEYSAGTLPHCRRMPTGRHQGDTGRCGHRRGALSLG